MLARFALVVLAYVSGAVSRSGAAAPIAVYAPVIKAVWPFVVGCVSVALAGAAAFFNFSYAELGIPSSETLHNFLEPTSATWPIARGQYVGETPEDFGKRFVWRIGAWRTAAICLALGSAFFFAYGVFRVLHVVLS